MPVSCKELTSKLEEYAPLHFAQEWDNVGLLVGDENKDIERVLISLELTKDILKDAIDKKVDLIITHHPLIFKPIKNIINQDQIGDIIIKLIKHDINLYCAHTNLDITQGGTSDYLGKILNIKNMTPLSITYNDKFFKLVVFTPEESADKVLEAISEAGAGNIGNYSACSFQSSGVGTFKPLEGANPHIGQVNKLERVKEIKLETIVPIHKINPVLNALFGVHPYEEVAYDLIPLGNKVNSYGFGRMGYLENSITLYDLALLLKDKLKVNTIKVIGEEEKIIQKLAICTGSGAKFIKDAIKNNCDCYISGDINYHDAQYAFDSGLSIIDAGHFETENIICKQIKEYLSFYFYNEVNFFVSQRDINPFNYI